MPTSADGDVVRRLYQAVADPDFTAVEGCFTDDVVWHLPGDSPIAGDHHGWPQIRALLGSGRARRLLAIGMD
jgi:ketosteroid isomerase-like protein